ncbi:hypothetical protein CAPTEDRAFT_184964 [Capitella teleta]|uniref:Uncharacterized protein n=1 Tax=Capitella teleta TaxID=283909 RepID=R7UFG8_CAPTE|nr:hypothetical protein CAPTEDRAFT_184964 [Capitella teleta]|eukprot:ELU04960.1 hypothetical protein CAPTEDRAFT_184964 [Capitella teleta]
MMTETTAISIEESTVTSQQTVITTEESTVTTQPTVITTEKSTVTTQPTVITTEKSTVTTQPTVIKTEESTVTTQPTVITTVESKDVIQSTEMTNEKPSLTIQKTVHTTQPKLLISEANMRTKSTINEAKSVTANPQTSPRTSFQSQELLNSTMPVALAITISPSTELPSSHASLLPSFPMTTEYESSTPDRCEVQEASNSGAAYQCGIVPRQRPPLAQFSNVTKEKEDIVDSKYITSHVVIGCSFVVADLSFLLLILITDLPRILQHIHYLNVPFGRLFNIDQKLAVFDVTHAFE